MTPVRAVIPMKPLARCKQRLAGVLAPDRREALSLWMLERVIAAATGSRGLRDLLVLGGDPRVAALCRAAGARWDHDPREGLNATLDAARRAGTGGMLFLAGDLPLLEPADIDAMIEAAEDGVLVLGRGRRGGTNAALVPAGVEFRFQLGSASYQGHVAQAQRMGILWREYDSPRVQADVDLPEDLIELEHVWDQVAAALT